MSDHDALLNAIAEHPEEDTPRLMYADWLDENGEPERADFVRAQVEIGRAGVSGAELYAAVQKNRYYLGNFVRHWRDALPSVPGVEWGDFNRGLVEEVRAQNERPVVDRAARIFAVPGIHVLRLWRLDSGRALAGVPELIRLRSLRIITPGTSASVLRDLFASPHLARLTALDLHGSRIDDALAAQIADGRFPDLAEVLLGSNAIGDAGAWALANSPHLARVRAISLWGNPIQDRAARNALRKKFGKALKM